MDTLGLYNPLANLSLTSWDFLVYCLYDAGRRMISQLMAAEAVFSNRKKLPDRSTSLSHDGSMGLVYLPTSGGYKWWFSKGIPPKSP